MVKIARKTDPRRLQDLKRRIHDEKYIAMAVEKIAQALTKTIVQED